MSYFEDEKGKTFWISNRLIYLTDGETNNSISLNLDSSIQEGQSGVTYNPIKISLVIDTNKNNSRKSKFEMHYLDLCDLIDRIKNTFFIDLKKSINKIISIEKRVFKKSKTMEVSLIELGTNNIKFRIKINDPTIAENNRVIFIDVNKFKHLMSLLNQLKEQFISITNNCSNLCNQERILIRQDLNNSMSNEVNNNLTNMNTTMKINSDFNEDGEYPISENIEYQNEDCDQDDQSFDSISENSIDMKDSIQNEFEDSFINNDKYKEVELPVTIKEQKTNLEPIDVDKFFKYFLSDDVKNISQWSSVLYALTEKSEDYMFSILKHILSICRINMPELYEEKNFYKFQTYMIYAFKHNKMLSLKGQNPIAYPIYKFDNMLSLEGDYKEFIKSVIVSFTIYQLSVTALRGYNNVKINANYHNIMDGFNFIRSILFPFLVSTDFSNVNNDFIKELEKKFFDMYDRKVFDNLINDTEKLIGDKFKISNEFIVTKMKQYISGVLNNKLEVISNDNIEEKLKELDVPFHGIEINNNSDCKAVLFKITDDAKKEMSKLNLFIECCKRKLTKEQIEILKEYDDYEDIEKFITLYQFDDLIYKIKYLLDTTNVLTKEEMKTLFKKTEFNMDEIKPKKVEEKEEEEKLYFDDEIDKLLFS